MTLIPLERMQLERVLFEAGVLPLFCNPSATRVISPPPCPPPPSPFPPRRLRLGSCNFYACEGSRHYAKRKITGARRMRERGDAVPRSPAPGESTSAANASCLPREKCVLVPRRASSGFSRPRCQTP
jgi:hypothetical protein